MAPLPKRRHSTRRGGTRKAAIRLKIKTSTICANCNAIVKPHQICPKCGFYQGKEMIVHKSKTKKK